ncbi:peptidoglycan DD-metalloendopeptidase family protein [Phosphitispora sp. TUW77]|uniref:peptidoglycan DD-metalloendopeptidase family protein n=1 Tax=Phosphitispora sp. TUW77 TaxID=3152361 RepID=UPI003AB2AB54
MNFRKIQKAVFAVLLAFVMTCFAGYGSPAEERKQEPLQEMSRELSRELSQEPVYYTVKKGDCLWSVAQQYHVALSSLAYLNELDQESFLYEGDMITIPVGDTITYTVNSGDTLWGLSRRFSIPMAELAEKNGFQPADLLLSGQKLILPASSSVIDVISNNTRVKIPLLNAWPVKGVVSSPFGIRNGRMHEGTDIAAEWGSPIKAVAGGKIVFSGSRGDYGKTVIIDHGNGFRSLYGHASYLDVNTGDRVSQGEVIARIGSTGRSTGPHLHLELLYRGTPYNPQHYLPN